MLVPQPGGLAKLLQQPTRRSYLALATSNPMTSGHVAGQSLKQFLDSNGLKGRVAWLRLPKRNQRILSIHALAHAEANVCG